MRFAEIVLRGNNKSTGEILQEISTCSSNEEMEVELVIQLFSKALSSASPDVLEVALGQSLGNRAILILSLYAGYLGSRKGEAALIQEIQKSTGDYSDKIPFAVALANLRNIEGARFLITVLDVANDAYDSTIHCCLDKCNAIHDFKNLTSLKSYLLELCAGKP